MSFNLCNLPPAEKALIEVDKAAAYAVWKERNGHLESVIQTLTWAGTKAHSEQSKPHLANTVTN